MRGLKLGLGLTRNGKPNKGLWCEAIEKKLLVSATQGNEGLTIAPHIAYFRNKTAWIAGLNTDKGKMENWREDKLENVALTDIPFTPDPGFDPDNPKFGDQIVCKVSL